MSAIRELQERLMYEIRRREQAERWLQFAIDREECVCLLTSEPPCWVCQVNAFIESPVAPPPSPASQEPTP